MGYMHIDNLYKNQTVLLFREIFAMEKIHGTSAHVSFRDGQLHYFPGGCKLETFMQCFDQSTLEQNFQTLGHETVVVFGEQYGGKQQGMGNTYGKEPRFIVFDVKIGDTWLSVENAHDVANKLGLEFVHYVKIPTTMEAIDAERDADSVQAVRNGIGAGKKREGIVLRPTQEFRDNRGERVIAKHKRDDFRETKTPRVVGDDLERLAGEKAAIEWVTDMRLQHVLDKLKPTVENFSVEHIATVITSMLGDIEREGAGEVDMTKATRKAISAATAKMFKRWLQTRLHENA